MIRWITEALGTAACDDEECLHAGQAVMVVDVRELADKDGNNDHLLRAKISTAAEALRTGRKVVVCCDMGISRSNAVAAGALMACGSSYDEAIGAMSARVNVSDINLALLRQIRALSPSEERRREQGFANLFVTGSTGYIGRALVAALESDYKIYTQGRDQLDLAHDVIALDSAVRKNEIDLIVHLAHPRMRNSAPAMGQSVAMLRNILEVCRLNSVPVLYLSGLVIYSGHNAEEVLTTGPNLEAWPRGAYGEAKFFCEKLIDLYKRNYGVKAIVLRPGSVYGPNMPGSTIFAKFCALATRGATIQTHRYRNGSPVFDFLHLSDLIDGIRLSLRTQPEEALHLGTGRGTSTHELAQMLSAKGGRGSRVETVGIEDTTYKVVVDPGEARTRLGWEAQITLESGLSQLWGVQGGGSSEKIR
jgi:nucleoside-diphosphate-sugar epimerase